MKTPTPSERLDYAISHIQTARLQIDGVCEAAPEVADLLRLVYELLLEDLALIRRARAAIAAKGSL